MHDQFSINEGFRLLAIRDHRRNVRGRPAFEDKLVAALANVSLSQLIDRELEEHNTDPAAGGGAVEMITRVFRRWRRG